MRVFGLFINIYPRAKKQRTAAGAAAAQNGALTPKRGSDTKPPTRFREFQVLSEEQQNGELATRDEDLANRFWLQWGHEYHSSIQHHRQK